MADVPLCPSEVAVIVAEPASFAVTSPLELTVAAVVLLDVQVTTRPDSRFPFASFGVAVSCTLLPSSTLADAGVTATVATGTGVTVILAVPLCPSDVAVIVAAPATTAVTRPLAFTVATAVLLLDQLMVRPESGLPFASLGVAVSGTVCPTGTLADVGATATDATGTLVTVILDEPLCPSEVAVIVATPTATPVTTPLELTVATALLLLNQLMTRPESEVPFASFGVAVSGTVCPTGTLADAGATATDATGALLTVMLALPLWPSLVAEMVVEPVATAVTSPPALTVAAAPFELVHATLRPVSGLPFASLGIAVSWTVPPVCRLAAAGVTATDATGTAVTVIAAVPLCPSLVAVIVAEPAATLVTRPPAFTVATAVLLLDQPTARPDSGLPLASLGVAASCIVCPAGSVADAGVTATDTTGTATGLTVIADPPLLPSDVAVIVAAPAATPVTSPLAFTVATAVLLLDQPIARPDSGLPLASLGVAASCTVWPACTVADAGVTPTDATGTFATATADVPVLPSEVAVIVAEPTATAVARPLAVTGATAALLLAHVTTRPASGLPLVSCGVAASWTVWPTCSAADAGDTATDATATGHRTAILAVSDRHPGLLLAISR
ncbi:MAG: hypothetical protein AUH78_16705 [Gemmatimonadetes bacterium 13_1_40CM_4_69_8]|nr:MAG: hypothetical protein AUH78_16705 [Gemmatimonadetes bacterium 13_1_40CM_4_69_8]